MSPSAIPPFTLTEEERSLLPSDDDVEFYAEHGWYLSKKLFTDAEVDELVAASERYYAGSATARCRCARRGWPTGSRLTGDVQRHNDYVHYEHTAWPGSCASRCRRRRGPAGPASEIRCSSRR